MTQAAVPAAGSGSGKERKNEQLKQPSSAEEGQEWLRRELREHSDENDVHQRAASVRENQEGRRLGGGERGSEGTEGEARRASHPEGDACLFP